MTEGEERRGGREVGGREKEKERERERECVSSHR